MIFTSTKFIIFFSLATILYYIVKDKYRWIVLLIASYYFYMLWNVKYTLFILITTITTYLTGILMDRYSSQKAKKSLLVMNLIINSSILFLFKYFNFISSSLNNVLKWVSLSYRFPTLDLLLPIGISFYTFKALGYTIDVYRENIKAEKHFGIFALFLSFFPQVLSGPIDRSYNLIPQFHEKHHIDLTRIKDGFILMLWGFFKKLVIADNLALFINPVFNHPQNYKGIPLILASIFFAFQIYCDFSGYSDVAIGCAKVLGFNSINNFNNPYTSKSVPEFWRRWHISLSSWFRDYVYIPLGGNRVSTKRWCFNQLIVFLLSGLWHGANWTFVIWGILHGILTIISKLTKNIRNQLTDKLGFNRHPRFYSILQMILTFLLVDFAWIFFKANSLSDAIYIISNMFKDISSGLSLSYMAELLASFGIEKYDFIITMTFLMLLVLMEYIKSSNSILEIVGSKPIWIRWSFYYILIFSIILLGGYGYGYEEQTQFLYVQF